MRVFQNLFDYGGTGIVALSTSNSSYGPVPAADYGQALLWKDSVRVDLFDLCTRPVEMEALREAMATLRGRLMRAVGRVHEQLDWAEARLSENFSELPCHAMQMGGNLLLLGFAGAIKPRTWRLIDVARQRVVRESDASMAGCVSRGVAANMERVPFLMDSQVPLASGADFVEMQIGMSRVVFVLDGERLVPAEWSLERQDYADNCGMRSGMLSQPDRNRNFYVLVDPHTGKELKSFPAPTRSKNWSRPVTTPSSDRVALAHKGGTVDIVDDLGEAHFSLRPFPQVARTEAISVRLSHDAHWLSADGWHVFRVVNLSTREVAELSVPEPNIEDDPQRVLHDRSVLATEHGVAMMDESGLSVIPCGELHWHPVTQPGRGAGRKAAGVYKRHLDHWRKPALALNPAKASARESRSWLYGSPDLPAAEVPRHKGQAMQLLARIDLEEVATVLPENPWPKQGALFFFTAIDAEGQPLEDGMFNLAATRVVWWNGPFAAGAKSAGELAAGQPLEFAVHKADLPDIGAVIVEAAMLDDAESEAYRSWLERRDCADQPSGHRLGGYPTILQHNDLEARAAHLVDDLHHPPRDTAEMAAASRWRLLLQLDSDEACMWGTDSGTLYFLIHDEALARQDFSRVASFCEGC